MKTVFTTDGLPPKARFTRFREALIEKNGVPVEVSQAGVGPFEATIASVRLGSIRALHATDGGLRVEISPSVIRSHDLGDMLEMSIQLKGQVRIAQGDRTVTLGPGDMTILSWQHTIIETSRDCEFLEFWLPRRAIEATVGSARLFSALDIPRELGAATLARSYLQRLLTLGGDTPASTRERLVAVGLDLVAASVAERMAREPARATEASLIVERAKAFIERNLADPNLDPPRLASAVSTSLRRLQALFAAEGLHISEWIWERRLVRVAHHLASPARSHMQIGTLAYDCGFVNQAHFSRRFNARFGMTPREYRWSHLLKSA